MHIDYAHNCDLITCNSRTFRILNQLLISFLDHTVKTLNRLNFLMSRIPQETNHKGLELTSVD